MILRALARWARARTGQLKGQEVERMGSLSTTLFSLLMQLIGWFIASIVHLFDCLQYD